MKPTILIGHGNETPNQNFKRYLSNQGFKIIEGLDAISIIRFFHLSKPHLIIINSTFDNKYDALDIIKLIRAKDQKVPIILITKYSSEDRVISALRAGVTDYFKQPFSFGDLMESINRNLSISSHKPMSEIRTSVPNPSEDRYMIGQSEPIQNIKA